MTSQDDLTEDQLVELEELRQILLQRLGMMSSVAKAYAEYDIDMMRAMKKISEEWAADSTRALDIARVVYRLRRIHDCHDVSQIASAAHIEVQNSVSLEMQRVILSTTGAASAEHLDDIEVAIDLGFADVRRLPLLLSIIAAGTTNPEEIATIMDSMSDQSLTLAEGTL